MKHELNDETLTAYALGELDAAETKAVEKLLADAANAGDEIPRKTLDEIRAAIEVTEAAFADSAPDVALTSEQRASLETTAQNAHPTTSIRRYVVGILATAAVLAIVAMLSTQSRVIRDVIVPAEKFDVASNNAPAPKAAPVAAQPTDTKNVPFFLNTKTDSAAGQTAVSPTPAPISEEKREQLEAVGYGASKTPPVDPLRYESAPKQAGSTTAATPAVPAEQPAPHEESAPVTEPAQAAASEAEQHYREGVALNRQGNVRGALDEFNRALALDPNHTDAKQLRDSAQTTASNPVASQPRDNGNETNAGVKVDKLEIASANNTTTAAPTPKKEAEASKPLVWIRKPRPDPATTETDDRSERRLAKKSKQDVVLSPDTAGASVAAAAPPAAPAPLPEIQSDALFSRAPQQIASQPSDSNYGFRSLGGVAGANAGRASALQEQEQLHSLGYSDGSGGAKFKTAAIDDRTGFGIRQRVEQPGTEAYAPIPESPFIRVSDQPLSTFSIDVDTASYSNVRRFLESGQLPPPDAVRVEELINYFDYAYPAPEDGRPFAAHFEAAACPWSPDHTIVRIGLKGREVPRAERPATNLVFLIDVSGSMADENKLPLVKRAMAMLTRQLDERDRVSIVTYASGVNLALPVTNASNQDRILAAIDNLGAGGSTNGAGGIQLAYQSARENFLQGGVNRVILATDGDFNVGISDNNSLLAMIQQEAKSGVFLSVFGFGMGNLKDDKLEMLADKGNGVYGYIDSDSEARKIFVEKLSGTLVTIAKDVKIQVEFNPSRVAAYKLIGYENRTLAAQDFNDDRKDAGEIGAGHTVTALYEVVPVGKEIPATSTVDALRYQTPQAALQNEAAKAIGPAGTPAHADELLLVKLRYKEPEGAESKLLEFPLKDQRAETMSADLKFASAVAAFGRMLRGSGMLNYDTMLQLAQAGLAASNDPRRAEVIHLMLQARPLIEGRYNNPQAYGLSLEQIRAVGDGTYRAKIRTPSRSAWYANGDAFEQYQLLSIDPSNGCVMLRDEGRNVAFQLCFETRLQ